MDLFFENLNFMSLQSSHKKTIDSKVNFSNLVIYSCYNISNDTEAEINFEYLIKTSTHEMVDSLTNATQ